MAFSIGIAHAQDIQSGLSATDLFAMAGSLAAEGQTEDALAVYTALARDPDGEVRAEARFRRAMLLASMGRYRDAAIVLRALLDEKPNASRVQLELARALAALGDEPGARRALRAAQASGLPAEVAIAVSQFAGALRSAKSFGGSLQVALAPDSNINRATNARTLDTVIAPLTLSQDARERSGLGLRVSGQAFARLALSDRLSLAPRISGLANLYRADAFNDISGSALIGLQWQSGRDRLTPSMGVTWRWYGPTLFAHTDTVTLDWLHPMGRRTQLTVSGSAARARYQRNALQNGALLDLTANLEHALSARSGIGAGIGVTRQTARDPGYALTAGHVNMFGWREAGKTTVFANVTLRRSEGDARLFLFPEKRKEWFYQVGGGATFRSFTIAGFSPIVRSSFERNISTVGLYRYRRLTADFGITRAF